jgi:hypothetical protein
LLGDGSVRFIQTADTAIVIDMSTRSGGETTTLP